MPAATITRNPPASRRNSDSPADQALAKVVDLLLPAGYGFTIPAWDGDAYLRINNALRALTAMTITSHGDVTWEYRATQPPHLHPSRLVGVAIELLDPDHTRPEPVMGVNDGFPLIEIIRFTLSRYGFTATITETGADTGPVLTAANPDLPYRGFIEISDDGELTWHTRAPHHPDGGIPLPDLASTISRAYDRGSRDQSPISRPRDAPLGDIRLSGIVLQQNNEPTLRSSRRRVTVAWHPGTVIDWKGDSAIGY